MIDSWKAGGQDLQTILNAIKKQQQYHQLQIYTSSCPFISAMAVSVIGRDGHRGMLDIFQG